MDEIVKIFIITILAELVAVGVLAILGAFFSRKARWILTVMFGRLLDIDVEHVFRNKRQAEEDIREEIESASFVYLLTGRGNELQRETFSGALSPGAKRRKEQSFRILLPASEPSNAGPDWTAEREKEVATIDPAFGAGILRDQIETTVKFLSPYVGNGVAELRRFDYPHIGRVLITDRVAYFTPYREGAHGRDSRIIKYRRGGEMYDFLFRLFKQLWDHSR